MKTLLKWMGGLLWELVEPVVMLIWLASAMITFDGAFSLAILGEHATDAWWYWASVCVFVAGFVGIIVWILRRGSSSG